MPQRSAADLLTVQLESAATIKDRLSPKLALSTPPASSFSTISASSDSLPPTTGNTWSPSSDAYPPYGSQGRQSKSTPPVASGLAAPQIVELGIDNVPLPKLQSRTGTNMKQDEDEGEEETDEELENELNDFGYGARPRRRKEKKESLLDILNSDPPGWMNSPPPPALDFDPPAPAPSRSGTFGRRFRERFGGSSTSTTSNPNANHSSTEEDSQAGFTTLRSSRSAGNLLGLGNLGKGSLSSAKAANRSRDDLAFSTSPSGSPSFADAGDFSSSRPNFTSVPPRLPKLSAKDAAPPATQSSTRDLADFLRTSAPPSSGRQPDFDPPSSASLDKENSLSSLKNTGGIGGVGRNRSRSAAATLHKSRPSRSGTGGPVRGSREASCSGTGGDAESVDTATTSGGNPSTGAGIIKAAMVKLGGSSSGRRASLTPFSAAMMLSSSSSSSTANGQTRSDSTGSDEKSEDGTGDIRVDKALMDGMFGLLAKPVPPRSSSSRTTSSALSSPGTATSAAGTKPNPTDSPRAATNGPGARDMGVRDFVEMDEGMHASSPRINGRGLPIVTRAGELPGMMSIAPLHSGQSNGYPTRGSSVSPKLSIGASATGLVRSGSLSSESSLSPLGSSRVASPNKLPRKPVPSTLDPLEELLLASSTSSTRKPIRDETLASLLRLQERGDTSPLAVGESPVKGVSSPSAAEKQQRLEERPKEKEKERERQRASDAKKDRARERERERGASAPFTSFAVASADGSPLAPTSDEPTTSTSPATPQSPIPSVYGTPPVTPTPNSSSSPSGPTAISSLVPIIRSPFTSAPNPTPKNSKRPSVAATLKNERPTSPLPEAPLPAPLVSSSADKNRPTCIVNAPTPVIAGSQSLAKAARRISLNPTGVTADSPSDSVDSFVDPPLSATAIVPSSTLSPRVAATTEAPGGDLKALAEEDSLFELLRALQESMKATADLPLSHCSTSHPSAIRLDTTADGEQEGEASVDINGVEKVNAMNLVEDLKALIPVLKGMKEGMEIGARLIGKVLERVEVHEMEEKVDDSSQPIPAVATEDVAEEGGEGDTCDGATRSRSTTSDTFFSSAPGQDKKVAAGTGSLVPPHPQPQDEEDLMASSDGHRFSTFMRELSRGEESA